MSQLKFRDFGLIEKLDKEAKTGLRDEIKKTLKDEAFKAVRRIQSRISRGGGVTKSRTRLRSRTGQLRRSIASQLKSRGGINVARIGTIKRTEALKYARIHEEGTRGAGGALPDIVPRTRKFLTIPLPAALTKAGVTRFTAGELKDNPSLGNFANTFIRESKKGNLIVFGVKIRKGANKPQPLFVLKKRVAIPARPFVRPEFDEMRRKVEGRIRHTLTKAVTGRG